MRNSCVVHLLLRYIKSLGLTSEFEICVLSYCAISLLSAQLLRQPWKGTSVRQDVIFQLWRKYRRATVEQRSMCLHRLDATEQSIQIRCYHKIQHN